MIAGLHDRAILHNDDTVGIANRGQAVRDDETRAVLHQSNHCFLDVHLRPRIDRRGCFVQNENLRIGKNRAGNREQLSLSLTEIVAALGQYGVVSVRKPFDEFPRLRRFRRRLDLIHGRVQLSVPDIVRDSILEQYRILQNNRDRVAQGLFRNVLHVDAIDGNPALIHVIESGQQVDDRRFAGAGRADKGDLLSVLHIEIEIKENLLFRIVGEVDVREVDVARDLIHGDRILAIVRLIILFQNTEYTLSTGNGSQNVRVLVGDLIDRLGELAGIL